MEKNKGLVFFFTLISVCSMCCVWWSALLHSCNYLLFCTRLITFVLQIAESCREKKSLATLKFSISTNLDQKAERKTFPVSTFLQGKYFFVLQGILFSLLGSCSHYRNLSACPLLYPVQDCNVQCTEVQFASFFSGGFVTAIIVNPPERKMTIRTSVQKPNSYDRPRLHIFST